jgi:hypothetical protein
MVCSFADKRNTKTGATLALIFQLFHTARLLHLLGPLSGSGRRATTARRRLLSGVQPVSESRRLDDDDVVMTERGRWRGEEGPRSGGGVSDHGHPLTAGSNPADFLTLLPLPLFQPLWGSFFFLFFGTAGYDIIRHMNYNIIFKPGFPFTYQKKRHTRDEGGVLSREFLCVALLPRSSHQSIN